MNMTSLIPAGAERDSKVSSVGFLEEKTVKCLEYPNYGIVISQGKKIKT